MSKKFFIVIFIFVFLGFGGNKLFSQIEKSKYSKMGISSYYSMKFHNKKTASGERFDMYAFTAAHLSFAFGTMLKVTNLSNEKSTIVRVNDRGPYKRGRMIDVSYAAALELDMLRTGTARVKIEVITNNNENTGEISEAIALNTQNDK